MTENCEYYEELLSRMCDGDVSEDEMRDLRAHTHTCAGCAALMKLFSVTALALRGAEVEPPAALLPGVMERIASPRPARRSPRTEAEHREELAKPRSDPRQTLLRVWPKLAVAASLALVIGVGALLAVHGGRGSTAGTADAGAEVAQAPLMAVEEALDGADERPAEFEMAEAEVSEALPAPAPRYTRDNPAAVPAEREAEFEALIQDARWGEDGAPEDEWNLVAAVEYQGVIYEFMTNETEDYLLWQDAAEGLPVHSPGTVAQLWDIIG